MFRSATNPISPYRGEPISGASKISRVGMPHLTLTGLSENWLLKECGHQHWTLLARLLGLRDTDFRDSQGNRLYAAFTAVRISDAHLANARENDVLTIVSWLGRISQTQYLSAHRIMCEDRSVADVTMISVFLCRTVRGSNRTVAQASAVAAVPPPIIAAMPGKDLMEAAHHMRRASWHHYFKFFREDASVRETFTFRPCPHGDFNGADFLYFASFQSIVDRAEWEWCPDVEACAPTRHREIFYYGNIDVGESLRVDLCATYAKPLPLRGVEVRHWCRIFREYDGKMIADVFTSREIDSERDGLQ